MEEDESGFEESRFGHLGMGGDLKGHLERSRSAISGSELVEGVGTGRFLLGRWIVKCLIIEISL